MKQLQQSLMMVLLVVVLVGVVVGMPLRADAQVPQTAATRRQSYDGHHGLGFPISHHHHNQHHRQPVDDQNQHEQLQDEHEDKHEPADYSFGYSVQDEETGDLKSQHETRQGDVVSGRYSLREPDGRLRIVTYRADDVNGFQAQVRNQGEPMAAGTATARRASPAPARRL